ncbi:MAG: N-acyl homoserine lactonase family protein [Chloroflexi bacterium]|nr:N-acyl homoserine lactonase family protein [Chloroflexota bacterium]
MDIRIHAISTGAVKLKTAQPRRKAGGALRILLDRSWTEWLPMYAWVVEHPEGVVVVDTGETARTSEPDYFHWAVRISVRMDVSPEQEIGPQLRDAGFDPDGVRMVVMTHLHTDHAGGLHHFPNTEILASNDEYQYARNQKLEYPSKHWPDWFSPSPIPFEPRAYGPFEESYSVTEAGDVVVVPTPGHTPHHVSVIVKTDGLSYFLAGDTSYTEEQLLERHPDAVSPKVKVAVQTMDRILRYAETEPTVYLPSHDPGSAERLRNKQTLNLAA